MKLIIVRHGETNWNVQNRIQGRQGEGLNEKGKIQAQLVAERLKEEKFDFAYSSDQQRAVETCNSILKFHPDLTLTPSEEIRERGYGEFEGKYRYEVPALSSLRDEEIADYAPKGGESLRQVQVRAVNFFSKLKKMHHGKTVLVVSHGATIRCLIQHLLEMPFSKEELKKLLVPNCALTIIDSNGIGKLSCIEHLQAINL